ncbi:hypothetical protein [Brevundimonas sp. P7753]|uniref:hypothetical protein n=1 Tax=Brevundimonas sp. P7753 TaxID=2726982 RepID=UPI0015BB0A57|nr:hypothetical protein [Brevundimonas sp. P7753]NWE53695.1 hypothetical protein [Brevundimonas sp. P7753]
MAEAKHTCATKVCTACGGEKLATEEFFHANPGGAFGLRGQCRECRKARIRELIAQPDQVAKRSAAAAAYTASGKAAAQSRAWRAANPDSALRSKRKWAGKNRDHVRQQQQGWRDANRPLVRAKQRRQDAKVRTDPSAALRKRMRDSLRRMAKGAKAGRGTFELLGYGSDELRTHLERQFTAGMNWERLMAGEIHIDHILPVAHFGNPEPGTPGFAACWGLTNLRPMWAVENQRKQARRTSLL